MGLFSSIGSALGGIAGSALGNAVLPGIGGAIGGSLGSSLGGSIGGGDAPAGAPGNSFFGGPQYTYQQYEREKVLPDYLQQPYEDTVSAVMDAGTEPFKPYSYEFRPELFAPDEIRAQELYRELPGRYSPYVQGGLDVVGEAQRMALGGPDQALLQGYMNPFIENVLDVQKQRSLQDYQMMHRNLQKQAGQVGSFGGSRFGIAEAQLADDFGLRQDQLESQMLMAGYDRALAGLERGLDRGLVGATQGLGGLQGIDIGAINALQQSGQRQYARDYGEFIREISDPMLKAGFLAQNMQPLAATVVGERGTSLGYTDPNAGALGEALGIYGGLKGIAGEFPGEIGKAGDFLQDTFGTRLGLPEDFGRTPTGNVPIPGTKPVSKAMIPIPGRKPVIAANQGGLLYNIGGMAAGLDGGDLTEAYDLYLNAAMGGPGFVNPTGFQGGDFTTASSPVVGATGDATPAGGLLGALERMKDEKAKAEGKDSQGSEQTEGKETPGPESEGLYETLQGFAKALGVDLSGTDFSGTKSEEGAIKANEGGRLGVDSKEAQEYLDMVDQLDYQAIADKLNESTPEMDLDGKSTGKLDAKDVYNMMRSLGYPPVPETKPERRYNEQGQVQPVTEEEEKEGMNAAQAIGLGLAGPTLAAGAWNLGKKFVPPAAKLGLQAGKWAFGTTKGQAITGGGLYGAGSLYDYLKGNKELTEADKKAVKDAEAPAKGIAAGTESGAKKTGQGGREILSLPQTNFATRSDVRGMLAKSLAGADQKQADRSAAWAAFGAKMTEGGGFAYSFPRASLEFQKTIMAQETAKFNKQKALLELENDMLQKETNRETNKIAAQIALAKLPLLVRELDIKAMEAQKAGRDAEARAKDAAHAGFYKSQSMAIEKMWESVLADGDFDKKDQKKLKDMHETFKDLQGYSVNEKG
jgi:hypothetical protein